MGMVSALLGFIGFKILSKYLRYPFTAAENVLIQTVATATGCMPVTAGFTGTIPALEHVLTPDQGGQLRFSFVKLLLWSFGLCFFGLIFASLLRDYFIIREKMPWPGVKATANMIRTLHSQRNDAQSSSTSSPLQVSRSPEASRHLARFPEPITNIASHDEIWQTQMNVLLQGVLGSGGFVSAHWFRN